MIPGLVERLVSGFGGSNQFVGKNHLDKTFVRVEYGIVLVNHPLKVYSRKRKTCNRILESYDL